MSKSNVLRLVLAIASVLMSIDTKTAFALNPTAIATTTNVTVAGSTSYSFTVTYNDDGDIAYGTLDSGDVRITGPGGFNSATTFVSAHSTTMHNAIATYSVVPPGGSWGSADNGTYTVVMQANQVTDGIGNPVAPGPIGTFTVSVPSGTPTPTPASSSRCDFNRDGKPDYLIFDASTRQTAIWYLNNNVFVSTASGPALPSGWQLIATGDLNGDGKPDFVLYNPSTLRTAIWYLNNNVFVSGTYGPTLPIGYALVGLGDFNRDGKLDYLLFNPSTRQTAIWYLNNNVRVSAAYGPTIASGYVLSGTADFNRDGKPDYVLFSPGARQTAIWYMNNNVHVSGAFGPTVTAGWSLAAP